MYPVGEPAPLDVPELLAQPAEVGRENGRGEPRYWRGFFRGCRVAWICDFSWANVVSSF